MTDGWIGVDLDGTLAYYDHWRGIEHIGAPVMVMLRRVQFWLAEGRRVKIFTARAAEPAALPYIKIWLHAVGLPDLEITNVKDMGMVELWDDRCVKVEQNTGRVVA